MRGAFSIDRARLAQRKIAERVREVDEIDFPVKHAAGVDVAYVGEKAVASAVVVEYPSLKLVEAATATVEVSFPYVPTLLAFREAWPAYRAIKSLGTPFQVLFVDGNGRLHPLKAGFACHLGVVLDKPTIGVAKKLLVGEVVEINERLGKVIYNGETLAYAIRLRGLGKRVYVSVGHKVTLETALRLTIAFTKKNSSLPEPLIQAHSMAKKVKERLKELEA
ncbi:endonuclease V [Infirmifilum lucidum]|uniref:Endonuclease V n=1 Tax=Infirmifilum lucidum TaxID=2776706 RepID=A0A7L9FJU6_9CREN|nr:endonuclease V [Infirmifilum lucidum]QOJ79642.1 endonuclease V [Infirmifilum lucidum]